MNCRFFNIKTSQCMHKALSKCIDDEIILHIPSSQHLEQCGYRRPVQMTLKDADKLVSIWHSGQVRKFSGLPYKTHLDAVSNAGRTDDEKILGKLHDILEDTSITMKLLVDECGLSKRIADALNVITRYEDQTYLSYIQQFKYNDLARAVKIEDIKHNMSDLDPGCMYTKYSMALYILEEVIPSQIARGE